MRIIIVDDHAVVRQGLRFVLEQQTDIAVVGEGEDGAQGVALAAELLPDVVLMDLLMPGMDGVTAIREIARITPTTRIIVLTSYHEDDQIFAAIKAGALSYLLKDIKPPALIAAVRGAVRGESVLHPMVAKRVLRDIRHGRQELLGELTPREVDVLMRVAHGRSNREIALDLSVGEQTIKTHVSNILMKLHLADRTQAAIYALQEGLVPLKDALDTEHPRE